MSNEMFGDETNKVGATPSRFGKDHVVNSYRNDEKLAPSEILGRCGTCNTVGNTTIDVHSSMYVDKILAYRPFPCFCPVCKQTTEFVPLTPNELKGVATLFKIQNNVRGMGSGIVKPNTGEGIILP